MYFTCMYLHKYKSINVYITIYNIDIIQNINQHPAGQTRAITLITINCLLIFVVLIYNIYTNIIIIIIISYI